MMPNRSNMKKVLSSHVWEVGYEPASQVLHVRYQPTLRVPEGRLVEYHGVSAEAANTVLTAPSIGKALHEHIRGKHEMRG